jgi:flavodoxin
MLSGIEHVFVVEVAVTSGPKILVVYYSRTGHTERMARTLAAALHARCEPIAERGGVAMRRGLWGYLRSLADVLLNRPVRILPDGHDLLAYDLVAIGTPVWAGRAAAPVGSWLRIHAGQLPPVAFFCSMGGRGSESAFATMQAASGKAPLATCAVSACAIRHDAHRELLGLFAKRIGAVLATPAGATARDSALSGSRAD